MNDKKPELLAPAGNIESFYAAVESGADAVYLGLKKFSARATASNFTMEELATLMPFARRRGVRIYVTVNSLVAASEIPSLLDTLHALSKVEPDALIVQDPGVFLLCRRYFPGLKLHASTLMAAHNGAGVNALARLGAERVVLARELSVREIESICLGTKAELEIFVHGALCYSYSGLCLTSSFRGGRSGLRGECVQPCRLKFRQGKNEGFFLSCGDLCALPSIPVLKRLRIAGFKIEGRMKPADYIGTVVRAYRMVLDAPSGRQEMEALEGARELFAEAPSRRLTSGFLGQGAPSGILAPHRSGSSGIWTGTVESVAGNGRVWVQLRRGLEQGDRLRPESSGGKEREAFIVTQMFGPDETALSHAGAGDRVLVNGPEGISSGDRIFKVGGKSESSAGAWRKIRREVPYAMRFTAKFPAGAKVRDELRQIGALDPGGAETLFVKVGSANELVEALQSEAGIVLLTATRANLERIARQRFSVPQRKKLGLSLPALLTEDKDMEYYRAAVGWFLGKGFRTWEINNWGHLDLLEKGQNLRLIAGARMNIRNVAAVGQAFESGCNWGVLSVEMTKDELAVLAAEPQRSKLVVAVHSWPALFVSRIAPALAEDRPFFTARGEGYHLQKHAGITFIYADRPVDWCAQLPFLRSQGYRNFMIDVSEGPAKRTHTLRSALRGFAASRSAAPCSLFNWERRT